MIALLWRLPHILVHALLPLLCVLCLTLPVGGLVLWVQVQQQGYVDVCVPALLGGACVFVMPGDVDVTWG